MKVERQQNGPCDGNAQVFYAYLTKIYSIYHMFPVSISNDSRDKYFAIVIWNYFACTLHNSRRQITVNTFAGRLWTNRLPSRRSLTYKLPVLETINNKRRKSILRVILLVFLQPVATVTEQVTIVLWRYHCAHQYSRDCRAYRQYYLYDTRHMERSL